VDHRPRRGRRVHAPDGGPIVTVQRRWFAALALVLVAAVQIYVPFGPPWANLALVFFCGVGIGLLLGEWWALLLALVVWPLQLAVGFVSGRVLFLGDGWEGVAAIVNGCCLAGIVIGLVLVRTVLSHWRTAVVSTLAGRYDC